MNTLLATNILLAVIVLCIIVLTILMAVVLINVAGTTRRVKHIVTVFDDDVIRARSVVVAVKDLIVEQLFPKKKK